MKRLILAGVLIWGAAMARADEITVFAASSLKTAFDQIAQAWQAQSGVGVVLVYDGSAKLANQILQGAPADVFASASVEWMDAADAGGALQADTRRNLLGNELVLIGAGAWPPTEIAPGLDLKAMLGDGRLAIGQRASVPVGQYGRQALEALGLWSQVEDHLAEVETARAGLDLVARGEVPLGIVFASDAVAGLAAGQQISVIGTFPEGSHSPILYPVALTATAAPQAQGFMQYLSSPAAREIFVAQGFKIVAEGFEVVAP